MQPALLEEGRDSGERVQLGEVLDRGLGSWCFQLAYSTCSEGPVGLIVAGRASEFAWEVVAAVEPEDS